MRAPFSQLATGLSDAIRIWEKLDRAAEENEAVDLVRSSVALLANEAPVGSPGASDDRRHTGAAGHRVARRYRAT